MAARGEGRICMSERKYEHLEYLCTSLWPPVASKEMRNKAIEDYGGRHPRPRRERLPERKRDESSRVLGRSEPVAESASPPAVRRYFDDEDEQARLRLKAWNA